MSDLMNKAMDSLPEEELQEVNGGIAEFSGVTSIGKGLTIPRDKQMIEVAEANISGFKINNIDIELKL